jgi:hypothetical protein
MQLLRGPSGNLLLQLLLLQLLRCILCRQRLHLIPEHSQLRLHPFHRLLRHLCLAPGSSLPSRKFLLQSLCSQKLFLQLFNRVDRNFGCGLRLLGGVLIAVRVRESL